MQKEEKSAGAIIFYKDKNEVFFLLLKYKTYWGFVKGIIEENETPAETIKRETLEESNLKLDKFIPGFQYTQRWFYRKDGNLIRKEALFFLAEIRKQDAKEVKISFEHEDFKFLNYENSINLMKIKSNREMLKSAYEFIKKGYQTIL